MTRVLVVDDQPLIRSAMRALLEDVEHIEVVGEAGDGRTAIEETRRTNPDVVLMDVRMPVLDGLAATRRIREELPATQVIVLTTYDLDDYVFEAIRAGAAGFFLKDGDADDLVRGIRAVASGEALMAPSSLRRLLGEFAAAPTADPEAAAAIGRLTDREREVLRLLAAGLANAEIADRLYLGVGTVKTHVSSVLAKLGVRDRTQAVVVAYQGGLAPVGDPR
jgi:DNA-binding NarL/FixJ family response regulator